MCQASVLRSLNVSLFCSHQSVTASPSQHHVDDPGPDGDLCGVGVTIVAVVADAVIDDSSVDVVVLFFLVYFTSQILWLEVGRIGQNMS